MSNDTSRDPEGIYVRGRFRSNGTYVRPHYRLFRRADLEAFLREAAEPVRPAKAKKAK